MEVQLNMSKQKIEEQLQSAGEHLRVTLDAAFKEWPQPEATAATITVLMELAIVHAIASGVTASTFVSGVLSAWEKSNKKWEEFCRENGANEHLH
jgi:hypothetical protein